MPRRPSATPEPQKNARGAGPQPAKGVSGSAALPGTKKLMGGMPAGFFMCPVLRKAGQHSDLLIGLRQTPDL